MVGVASRQTLGQVLKGHSFSCAVKVLILDVPRTLVRAANTFPTFSAACKVGPFQNAAGSDSLSNLLMPEVPYPAMGAQLLQCLRRQGTGVRGGDISGHMANVAHSRNHSRDRRGRETEAQRKRGEVVETDAGVAHDGLHGVPDLLLAIAVEVEVAEVVLPE